MKISEIDAMQPERETKPRRVETSILVRAVLVIALTFTLVLSLRWAVDVTNANARRVSTNLTHIRGRLEPGSPSEAGTGTRSKPKRGKSDAGPVFVPADTP